MPAFIRNWLDARHRRNTRHLASAQLSLAIASGDKVRAERLKAIISDLED